MLQLRPGVAKYINDFFFKYNKIRWKCILYMYHIHKKTMITSLVNSDKFFLQVNNCKMLTIFDMTVQKKKILIVDLNMSEHVGIHVIRT